MSKIKLDLSQFKHIKSTKGMTTLQHKSGGHILTLHHDSLSPEGQAQLNQLAKMSETQLDSDEMNHKSMAKGGPVNAKNQKLAESKKVPPQTAYSMPSTTPMAEGGDVDEPQTPATPSPGDPIPEKAKAAIKGLHEPAGQQLEEGANRLMNPYTWWAEGGNVNSYVNQNPDAKPSPDQANQIMATEQTNPYESSAKISPEQVEQAQNIAMGTMGSTKVAAIPETIGPEIQATATKLSQALQKYGIDHPVTQTLAQKLKGLHEAISKYSGMADGGKAKVKGYDFGGTVQAPAANISGGPSIPTISNAFASKGDSKKQPTTTTGQVQPWDLGGGLAGGPSDAGTIADDTMVAAKGGRVRKGYDNGGNVSDKPPPSLNANSEDLTPTSVPTSITPESLSPQQRQSFEDRKAYQQAHDRDMLTYVGPDTMDLTKSSPEQEAVKERHAAEAGLNNVAIMHEDKEADALKQRQEQVQTSKVNAQLQAMGMPPLPGTNQPNAVDSTPPQPEQATMTKLNYGQQSPMQTPGDLDKAEGMVGQGYQNQMAGIQQAAQVAGQRGAVEEQALQKDLANKQAAAQTFQDSFKELNNERLAHINDIQKGYIDPEQYWKGTKNPETGQMEGGHSKLMAGIGMILAGFNPTSNPNQAVQMLQYQMNRNLDAQKANLGAKQNLLMANLHQFQNLRDATDMTRIMQHDMVANELQQAAAKTASPAAKAAALQAAGQLQMQTAPLMQQFAMRRAFMKLANGGDQSGGATEQMLNYMEASGMPQAKEMRDRYVPGLGVAATAVPQETKDRITAYQNVERMMNQAMQFSKEHEYNLNSLSPSDRAAGATIQNELISQIRTAEKQGVYKESEAKFMKDTLGGNPAEFFSAVRTQPKLMEMQQLKTNEYHNLLQNLGGNLLRNAQAVHAQVHSAPQSQNIVKDANGKGFTRQIINGKAYMVPVQ